MLKVKKVAVTGGLSSGKTTVCQIFEKLGAYVVSADEIVHRLLSPGSPLSQQVIDRLGSGVLSENRLDRKKVADFVFSQPEKLAILEALLHPAVFDEIEQIYNRINQEKQYPLFIVEIPLLYETQQDDRFDWVITVLSEEPLCRARFAKKNTTSPQDFTMRMKRQGSPRMKAQKAHYTIYNNASIDSLQTEVRTLYSQLTQA